MMGKRIFLIWRRISRRSRDLSRELGIETILIPYPPPYIKSYIETKRILREFKPNIVLAQIPQGPLLFTLAHSKDKLNYKLIVDVHSGFIIYDNVKSWILNRPFKSLLNKCDVIIVHNKNILNLLPRDIKGKTIVVHDPLPTSVDIHYKLPTIDNYIIVPSSWAPDEPIEYILKEYIRSRCSFNLVVTGNYYRRKELFEKYKDNTRITFTGYVDIDTYYSLLKHAKAVLAATKREYTMLSAAWEAIAYDKPLIISYTKTIYDILKDAPQYFRPYIEGDLENTLKNLSSYDLEKLREMTHEIHIKLANITEQQINKLKKLVEN